MKKLSCIFILLAIACIFTSCKLTGDFAIVKRQHAGGYYIQTPSFKRNVRLRSPSFVRINSASRKKAGLLRLTAGISNISVISVPVKEQNQ